MACVYFLKMDTRSDYYREKTKKLRLQSARREDSCIFANISIYVNGRYMIFPFTKALTNGAGYTIPSRVELRDMIMQHGGSFEAYETSRVTHVIASNLPNTKIRQYMKKKYERENVE